MNSVPWVPEPAPRPAPRANLAGIDAMAAGESGDAMSAKPAGVWWPRRVAAPPAHRLLHSLAALALFGAAPLGAQTEDEPLAATPGTPRIEVITNAAHPVRNVEAALQAGYAVVVYDLDAPEALDAELSRGLSANPDTAVLEVRARLDALGPAQLQTLHALVNLPLRKALQYELDRFPAVVFDGARAAVLGVTDLAAALDHYRRAGGGR